jgi:hypothetical protein
VERLIHPVLVAEKTIPLPRRKRVGEKFRTSTIRDLLNMAATYEQSRNPMNLAATIEQSRNRKGAVITSSVSCRPRR